MQISVADVDANGRALGTSTSFALCGQVRSQGESDDSLNRLATKEGRKCMFLTGIWLTDLAILKCSGMYGHTKNNGSQLEESICPYVHCYHTFLSCPPGDFGMSCVIQHTRAALLVLNFIICLFHVHHEGLALERSTAASIYSPFARDGRCRSSVILRQFLVHRFRAFLAPTSSHMSPNPT